jgi:hypothetical protein
MATLPLSKRSAKVLVLGIFGLVAFVLCTLALNQDVQNLSYAAGSSPSIPSCDLSWKVVPGPSFETDYNLFMSVSALSSTDIWAVGSTNNRKGTLAEHWDGANWNVFPTPNFGTFQSELLSVSAISHNDVWAVGNSYSLDEEIESYALHWDGSGWTRVIIPQLGGDKRRAQTIGDDSDFDRFYWVEALAPNDIWIAGEAFRYSEFRQVLMLHWDGTEWARVPAPSPGYNQNIIAGMEALSPNDIWAVGYSKTDGELEKTVTLHWDGSTWTAVPSPNPARRNFLDDVTMVSANNVYAVGYDVDDIGETALLMLQWNGSTWAEVPIPDPGSAVEFTGITAISANDIWATATYGDVFHWDGTNWSRQDISGISNLEDIGALSSTDIWAVGIKSGNPLALRYSADCALPTFTPTTTPTATNTPLPPRCAGERFTDVCPGDYFYIPVLSLNDAGIISGYNSTPPCVGQSHVPCYLPRNNLTRGQIAKIVSLAVNLQDPVGNQSFEDIPIGHTFYAYIERLAAHGIVSGYPCGGPGEPCIAPQNRPYFRAAANVSRGQLTKITSEAFGYADPHTDQTFEDVPSNSTFYIFIERLAVRTIINGYPCGGLGEPCSPPLNRPYFRAGNQVTRDQIAKIVYNARALVSPTPTSVAKSSTP